MNSCYKLPEILFLTTFPPQESSIAAYSRDLINALNTRFNNSFNLSVCALKFEDEIPESDDIKFVLNTQETDSYSELCRKIHEDNAIQMIVIQYDFELFGNRDEEFKEFLTTLTKPIIIVFHKIFSSPQDDLKLHVQRICTLATSIVVIKNAFETILCDEYEITKEKITVIPYGTHLVAHENKELLKSKFQLEGKKILSTFGLLSQDKSIETTLDALPAIIKNHPDILFLIIGKTNLSALKNDGESYRQMLEEKVHALNLHEHVQFINYFLPLPELLQYLQMTDIYLYTSQHTEKAISGTFATAVSCGCPVIATPVPQALELVKHDAGIMIDFRDSIQVSNAINTLLSDEKLRTSMSMKGLECMASTAWDNSAVLYAGLFEKLGNEGILLEFSMPDTNLDHLKKMTTNFGIVHSAAISQPDLDSGYTLDDNAAALIALCRHFEMRGAEDDIEYIHIYFDFIRYCLQSEGYFLNYIDSNKKFTEKNNTTNLADSNGRAIWALGYLISISHLLPPKLASDAEATMHLALKNVNRIHSTNAIAFVIKGLYYLNLIYPSDYSIALIQQLADRLVYLYKQESDKDWNWFESYLSYANSVLPEALLCAWLATGDNTYKEIAKSSFDFLLSKMFTKNMIKVVSNKGWLHKGEEHSHQNFTGSQKPVDVTYTIEALSKFYEIFEDDEYILKMEIAFNWFQGSNHLQQMIYNPCTGGCYDGLEEKNVNPNQGAEAIVNYLLARLTTEKSYRDHQRSKQQQLQMEVTSDMQFTQ